MNVEIHILSCVFCKHMIKRVPLYYCTIPNLYPEKWLATLLLMFKGLQDKEIIFLLALELAVNFCLC